jgi:hypothetical protein
MEAIVQKHFPNQADEFQFRMGVFKDLAERKFSSAQELQQHFGSLFTPDQAKRI